MSDLSMMDTNTKGHDASEGQDYRELPLIRYLKRLLPFINTACAVFLAFRLFTHPPVADYIVAYALVLALIVLGLHASDNWRTFLWGAVLAVLSGMTDRSIMETAPLILCVLYNLMFVTRRDHVRT